MYKNKRLKKPNSNSDIFGRVPEYNKNGIFVPPGDIHLTYGNRGMGALHISQRHHNDMEKSGFSGVDDVPAYVAAIIKPGTPVHCEGDMTTKGERVSTSECYYR